ncbi:MAG: GGDEF domain-containing protein [Gammaproteobacteria bacterium]
MGGEPVAATVDSAMQHEQWLLLARNVRSSTLPILLVGTLFAGFYTVFYGLLITWLWWAVLCICLGACLLATRRTDGGAPSIAFYMSMLAFGMVWAAAPVLANWRLDSLAAMTALILVGAVGIAGFGSYGIDMRAAYCVVLPIGFVVLVLGLSGGSPAHYAMGIAAPLLFVHQFMVARQARRVLVNQIRLRLENDVLVAELSQKAEKTASELEQRAHTERALRASRDRAERLSSTDALTEIANRRYFDNRLKAETSRSFRDRTPLSLIICDIDYFKQYNDLYGHQRGDECLKTFARTLSSFCRRGGDLAARIGGEEFALLLPATEHDAAMTLAEQACAAFDALAIRHEGADGYDHTTASFGVATVIPDALDAGDTLFGDADQALYRAKALGRNRVCSATPADATEPPASRSGDR